MSQAVDFDAEWASPVQWAAMYRACGLQVVPAGAPGRPNWKRPALAEWAEYQNAPAPQATFDRWYGHAGEQARNPQMGLILGLASGGVFCVDLDLYKSDFSRQWWADLLAENCHGQEPVTPIQISGGGGRHIFFRAPDGWSPPTFKTYGDAGIDIRGQGGFIVAAPSRHDSGKHYDWASGREPWAVQVVTAEEWLIEAIVRLKEDHGGGHSTGAREHTASADKYRSEGLRVEEIDDREDTMTRLVWGVLCDIRRAHIGEDEDPGPPYWTKELDRAWALYLAKVGSRLIDASATKEALLEREGRGYSEFVRKWKRGLRQWNGKLKADAGITNPSEPAPRYTQQGDGSFVDNETGEIHEPEPKASTAATGDGLPDAMTRVPGLVGDIIDWIEATARYPQRGLALGAALGLVGTVAGRKYATPTRSGTHLYTLALAPTGAGKNHASKQVKRLLKKAGLDALNGPSQYMSMSAVFGELTRKPRHLAIIDEFGGYMRRIASAAGSPHERAVKDILRTAWGCSFEDLRPLSYADGRVIEPIVSPALSIYGMSTPEEFYAALTGDDVFNGFLNRFLVIRVAEKPHEVEPALDEFEVPGLLLWGLARIKDRISGRIAEALADDSQPMLRLDWANGQARAVYVDLRKALERREEHSALLSRVAEMACRLATIRAIGRDLDNDTPVVSVDDIEWGRDLALWSADRMVIDAQSFMSETEHQKNSMLVLRTIRSANAATMDHSELVKKLNYKFKSADLKGMIASLIEGGDVLDVVTPPGPKGGRPKVAYVAVK